MLWILKVTKDIKEFAIEGLLNVTLIEWMDIFYVFSNAAHEFGVLEYSIVD